MNSSGVAREALGRAIAEITGAVRGRIGVCVHDIATGEEIGVNPDEPLPMASVCKVPILVAAYRAAERREVDLRERVEVYATHRCFGSGLLNGMDTGLNPTLRDLLFLMIVVSDNAATDLVLQRVPAIRVRAAMAELGFPDIRVERPIAQLLGDYFTALHPSLEGMRYGEWEARRDAVPGLKEHSENLDAVREAVNACTGTTETEPGQDTCPARQMARLCARIARRDAARPESCDGMLDILGRQALNSRLPRHLPPFVRFPHKTGTLGSGAVVNDAGILYINGTPVATIAVLSRDIRDPLHETETRLAHIGRAVYDYYAV
jgi:beta-lactamase class A